MTIPKIAINGFGRIGRSFFRAAFGHPDFDIVAVNDLTSPENLCYLLKYDTAYGRYDKKVETRERSLVIDGKEVEILSEKDPAALPWRDRGIDIVIESTGFFASDEKAQAHLDAGARRVVITAPAKGERVTTALVGANDDRFQSAHPITSNASCTTNSVVPVLALLNEGFGIERAAMTTVHGYTATQKLVDGPDEKDMRRGRAAAANIIPTSTGAAESVTKALPELEGKFTGTALRVPVLTGSLSITTAVLARPASTGDINNFFRQKAAEPRWAPIVKICEDPIVSSDIVGEPHGAIIDLTLTDTIGNLATVFSWYDNEAGYTATLIEHVRRVAQFLN
ncbi:MAG: type I glyceraldehyde-3-phosphate dehydrogenase [Patescibacteria group bacterium]